MPRRLLYVALVLAFVLHNDLWLWNAAGSFAGLPVGLAYHVIYCFVVAAILLLLVRFAWPEDVAEPSDP